MNFYYKKKMTAARATSSSDGQVLLLPFVGSPSFPTTPTNNSSSSASCSPIPVPLPQPPPCTPSCGTDAGGGGDDEHEVGRYYEIDHTHLSPKSPTQLKFVRVVMVKAKTKLDLIVSFPSMQSLRECFSVESRDELTSGDIPVQAGRKKRKSGNVNLHPELDEQFLMSADHALRILSRPVPKEELDSSQGHERFWVVNTKACGLKEKEMVLKSEEKEEDVERGVKTVDALRWGVKRKASYCGRQKGNVERNCSNLSSLVTMVDEDEGKVRGNIEVGVVENKRGRKCKMNKNINEYRKKFKREKKKKEISKLGMAMIPNSKHSTAIVYNKSSKDRWSIERYESAEMKLLSIMKEKNAVIGNRILRHELRKEARKHIGDTGLLDHLLKHMAGKVVLDGKERFRRRHNSDGAMEYWLEDVEFEEMRKSAGVADSAWAPPPGWTISDGVHTCGGGFSNGCAVEFNKLKEEISCLRRELEELHCLKQMEQEKKARDAQTDVDAGDNKNLQENMESLLKWKTKVEDEIFSMVSSAKEDVRLMREEMKQMRESKEREVSQKKSDKKDDNKVEKSGFRLWKPQDTFQWPNLSANPGKNNSNIISGTTTTTKTANVGHDGCSGISKGNIYMASPRSLVVPSDDVFGVPTPPSAACPPVLPLQLVNNNVGNGNTTTITARRHHHCHLDNGISTPCGTISDSTAIFCHRSSHGVFVPKTSMMMKGVEEWNTISTDLALASPSYNY